MSLHGITERWNLFGVTATALLTCVTGFVVLPPLDHGQDSFTHFGIFIVTVMVGLWFIPTQLWVSRRARQGWMTGGVLMLALGIAAYFFYDSKLNDWTFEYPANSGQREIAGSVLSENAQTVATRLKQAGQVASPSNVAWEMGGTSQLFGLILQNATTVSTCCWGFISCSFCCSPVSLSPLCKRHSAATNLFNGQTIYEINSYASSDCATVWSGAGLRTAAHRFHGAPCHRCRVYGKLRRRPYPVAASSAAQQF